MCFDTEKTQAPIDEAQLKHAIDQERRSRHDRFGDMKTAQIGRGLSDSEILAALFTYHPPTSETLPKFSAINQAAKNFAEIVLANCPPSADRSAAIRLIREARMTANAAISLNGLSL